MKRATASDFQKRILALIDDGAMGIEPIAAELGVSKRLVRRAIKDLGKDLQVPIPQMPRRARELGIRF